MGYVTKVKVSGKLFTLAYFSRKSEADKLSSSLFLGFGTA